MFATLPRNLEKHEKPGIRQFRQKKPKKTWNFEQKFLKNLEKPKIFNNFYMYSGKILI